LVYAQDVDQKELPNLLIELSKQYFLQLGNEGSAKGKKTEKNEQTMHLVHQCQNCLTVYDEAIGEPQSNIDPSTKFEDLPKEYTCLVCGTEKSKFQKVEIAMV
jgi:rubredoxin